ncbi:MAG: hypothetical protein J6Q81_08750 [Lentisphaeria bacterium]|nr:hypothetical protein [Lentisphaeria bacterium]
MRNSRIDIVIPLGSGSCCGNFELRMALRSIACCAVNVKNIYIATAVLPDWVQNVKFINVIDKHMHNKDANIIDKLLAAANLPELSEKFLFWSDDQLALHRFDAAHLPTSCNLRQYRDFNKSTVWHRRMRHTFEYLQQHNIFLNCNFDTHMPVTVNKKRFAEIMSNIDYAVEPGYCINTLYFGMLGMTGAVIQQQIKFTAESQDKLFTLPTGKLFLGYNDAAMQSDLPELLQKKFPEKCRYER